jgi:hypothetical protein
MRLILNVFLQARLETYFLKVYRFVMLVQKNEGLAGLISQSKKPAFYASSCKINRFSKS